MHFYDSNDASSVSCISDHVTIMIDCNEKMRDKFFKVSNRKL